jgi:hypothetical protein
MCLGQVLLVSIVVVTNGHCFDDQEDDIGQCHDPFGFVIISGAQDVMSKLCWGGSLKGLSIVVGHNVEDTVGLYLEWVNNCLMHGMCFFISKTAVGVWIC